MGSPISAVKIGSLHVERFETLLDAEHYAEIRAALGRVKGELGHRRIWHVNSTARGGGVAEMLLPLLSYARGAGVDARWLVISADDEFFVLTKRIHNLLHQSPGDGGPLGEAQRRAYEAALAPSAEALASTIAHQDVVFLHDPQTAGLIPAVRAAGVPVVWRCHVGADDHSGNVGRAWEFLVPYVRDADVAVFSREGYVPNGLDRSKVVIITPTIDAFAPKNEELNAGAIDAILHASGVRDGRPPASEAPTYTRMDGSVGMVTARAQTLETRPLLPGDNYVLQVSRWDALKDPLGVINGFAEHVAPTADAHLVYAGPAVEAIADDPEGAAVLEAAQQAWHRLPASTQERVHLAMLPLDDLEENAVIVNALQRAATVVIQKSIAEGFGLTVAEAMWKARPVVASRVGGIQDQIEHGVSGLLLDDPTNLAEYGAAVRALLQDHARATALGVAARERVRDHFLGTASLLAYLAIIERLISR